jgi:transposase
VARRRVGKYPEAFRRMALERMKDCASVTALAMELGVDRTLLYQWQRNADLGEEGTGSTADSPVRRLRKEVRDLKRVLAEKTLEVDFFKGALQKIEARRQGGSGSGGTASMTRSGR